MVISAIWSTLSGQNCGPYIRNPVYSPARVMTDYFQNPQESHWLLAVVSTLHLRKDTKQNINLSVVIKMKGIHFSCLLWSLTHV